MTEGLPRPVSTEDALAYAGRLDDLCNAEWVLKRLTDGANALRTLVSERDALAVRVSELEGERDAACRLIADDAYAISFQTMGQYRTAILKSVAKGSRP